MANLVGSSIIQAVSFMGAQWLFSQFDHKGYMEEIKRHNRALEDLTQARNKFFEEAQLRKEKIAKLEMEKKSAESDFKLTNAQFAQLKLLQHQESLAVEPQLDTFYEPSKQMKEYQMMATGIIGAATGATLGAVIKRKITLQGKITPSRDSLLGQTAKKGMLSKYWHLASWETFKK